MQHYLVPYEPAVEDMDPQDLLLTVPQQVN